MNGISTFIVTMYIYTMSRKFVIIDRKQLDLQLHRSNILQEIKRPKQYELYTYNKGKCNVFSFRNNFKYSFQE